MRASTYVVLLLCLAAAGGCGKKERSTNELLGDLKGANGAGERERIIAVRTLPQRRGDAEKVVPALIAALKDPEGAVRQSAALGLAGFGEQAKDAIPVLKEMATKDKDHRVRIAANQALTKLDPSAVAKEEQNTSGTP